MTQSATTGHPTPEAIANEIERLFISGDLAAAQRAADSAYLTSVSANSPWAIRFLVERAHINLYRGDNSEVVNLLTPKLPPSATLELAVRRYALLAFSHNRLNHPRDADRALAAALAIHPQGALASEVIGTRASIELDRDEFRQAENDFRFALDLAENADAKFQQTQMLINLGVIANQEQHFEDALDRFGRASALAESIGAKVTLQYVLINMGWVYYDTGDFLRSRENALRAYNSAVAMGENRHQVESLKIIGMSASRLHDQVSARMYYEQALTLAEQFHNSESNFSIHQALGYLLLNDNPTLAASHIHEATRLAAERKNPGNVLEQQLAEGLLLEQFGHTKEAVVMLRAFVANPASTPSLRWEAESNLGRLYEKAGDQEQSQQWFMRGQITFEQQRKSVHTVDLELPFLGNGNDLYFAYMDHLIRQQNTHAALDLLDRSRAETLADGLAPTTKGPHKDVTTTLNARAIATRLDATILFYCLRPGTSYLWSITPAGETFSRLPGKEVILPLIHRHNQSIFASEDLLTQKKSTGRDLYDMLVQPAIQPRPGQPTPKPGGRVILIADEELNDFNFETLIPPTGPPHYWIEDVTITNARSLRLLQASSTPAPRPTAQNALIIGDPIYRGTEYPELPNASLEISQVARHFAPNARTASQGQQAVPAAYAASNPGAFSYIHFVAHATSNETNPLDSAIVLSRPVSQPFAYRLYARDILNQPLHADLVTISACYGSGRRNYSGEGLVGLAWAFLRAGAHHVIGALWPVSDASTPELMDRLYTGLLAGSTPDAALRDAKLATIHAGGAFRKPLYWAPFQMYSGS